MNLTGYEFRVVDRNGVEWRWYKPEPIQYLEPERPDAK